MNLTDKVEFIVEREPGLTAWEVACSLSTAPHRVTGSVSSILHRMVKRGVMRRRKDKSGTWTYFLEGKA